MKSNKQIRVIKKFKFTKTKKLNPKIITTIIIIIITIITLAAKLNKKMGNPIYLKLRILMNGNND